MGRRLRRLWPRFFCLCLLGCLPGCQRAANPFAWLSGAKDSQVFDASLALGQSAYDEGDYSAALAYAEGAYQLNPQSEAAAILLGYVYLALAGLAPFELMERLAQQSSSESTQLPPAEGGAEVLQPSAGAEQPLARFSAALGISDADLRSLGELNTEVAALPVLEPRCAGAAREQLSQLTYANKAIQVMCPFVASQLRLSEDERHSCSMYTPTQHRGAEGHLLWALAHLLEAGIFYGVITYNTTGASKSNLEQRLEAITRLKIQSPAELAQLLEAMASFTTTLDKVLQVTGRCRDSDPQSQLVALVNDLIAISYAFAALPGLPDFLTTSLDQALSKLTALRAKGSGIADKAAQAATLKGDLTKKMTLALNEALRLLPVEQYSAAQVSALCQSFRGVSGSEVEASAVPPFCLEHLPVSPSQLLE